MERFRREERDPLRGSERRGDAKGEERGKTGRSRAVHAEDAVDNRA